MHFSFLEKFGLSVLICAWLIFGSIMLGRIFVSVDEPEALAYALPEGAGTEEGGAVAEVEEEVDFMTLLASADADRGARVFNKCKACHNIEAGGANKVGPNLWNIVGHDKAAMAGFSYSSALSGMEGDWTFDTLNAFLEAPKEYAPGNKMTFGGLTKPTDRANVIAYLNQQSDSPLPIEAPAPAAEEEPTEDQAAVDEPGDAPSSEAEEGEAAADGADDTTPAAE